MVRGRATPASQKSVPPPPYPPPLEQEGYHGLRGQPLHRLPLDLQRNGGNDVRLLSRLRTAANRDQRREDQPADPRQRAAAVAAPRLSADACDVAQGGAALGAGFQIIPALLAIPVAPLYLLSTDMFWIAV